MPTGYWSFSRFRTEMRLKVSCYAGYRGEETPRKFSQGDREVDVESVIDRWHAPEYRYFKCLGSDGDTYILRHDVVADRWELTMFARGEATSRDSGGACGGTSSGSPGSS